MIPCTLNEKKKISKEISRRYKIRNREEADVPNELKIYHRKLRNAITVIEEILLKKKELQEAINACNFKPKTKSLDALLHALEASAVNIFTAIRILNASTQEFQNKNWDTDKVLA